ncbi:CaiB/BaiF CoA transferase family protein [Phreatobacter stygius]|uniref:CaiB/BaiF CoA transferase family protein n=1 Tax=Phreatobacter stygius TaxID=1940610 RepID=UPI001C070551|nr:CoA transferase [Phreatobacter stygius]
MAGVKVIDLSRVLGGPFATQILGDHGAEVIKIEPPGGDETRAWGPPFQDETASYFLGVNRNKRGLALDLGQPVAREVLLRLLEDADVLVENFKTGTLEKWGLGYADVLADRFPRLIHCRVSGFGADGPLGGLAGYDAVIQAMAGLMSVNGEADGAPLRVGLPVVDMVTGLNAVIGILLALNHRKSTGRGQFVEAALFDSGLSLLHPHAANFFLSGRASRRTGNDHPNIAPYSVFATGGQPIFLAVGNDRQFARLCAAIGAAGIATDRRFLSNGARVANRDALRMALEAALAGHDGAELAARLIQAGVPAGPVLGVDEALAHPHAQHRQMVVSQDGYRGVGAPVKLSETPASYRRTPPAFGADSLAILDEAGFTQTEIDQLVASRAVPGPAA